jgi:hypothetical protein
VQLRVAALPRNHPREEAVTAESTGSPGAHRVAIEDPAIGATVVHRIPLHYSGGPDSAIDRPGHVRAASSIALIGGQYAIVQDDANFIAVLAADGTLDPITLPAGAGGERQFDDGRGNKHRKLDLEASVTITEGGVTTLFAFGSGSLPARERIVVVTGWEGGPRSISIVPAPRLYAALRNAPEFSGSELNIEGAALLGTELWLFGRGNGARGLGREPVNATCTLDWRRVAAHLAAPDATEPPRPTRVTRYDLGTLAGTPLGFTDAMAVDGGFLYSAAAEASPDAVRDGPVAGSSLGVLVPGHDPRWASLRDARGALFPGKVEGLAWADTNRSRLRVVVDHDDPDLPSELCTVVLEGRWLGPSPIDS